jgi:hypothetical protein
MKSRSDTRSPRVDGFPVHQRNSLKARIMPRFGLSRRNGTNQTDYRLGFGLANGNANVAETDGVGDVDPAGAGDIVDVADGLGDGVGVGLGDGIIFSQ